MQRRPLIKGVLLLGLLGAIANLAVAWAIAIRTVIPVPNYAMPSHLAQRPWPFAPPSPPTWPAASDSAFIWRSASLEAKTLTAWTNSAEGLANWRASIESMVNEARELTRDVPSMDADNRAASLLARASTSRRNLERFVVGDEAATFQMEIVRSGWPLTSMEGARCTRWAASAKPSPEVTTDFAISVGVSAPPPARQFQNLVPLRPIWPGFVVNTALYATAAWLLIGAPTMLYRWRRNRRIRLGLCPKCSYDLRGLAHERCPECGAAIQPLL